MENFDLTQSLSGDVQTYISAGGMLLLSAAIVLLIVIIKRWHARFMPVLLSVFAYIIFVFIIPNLFTSIISYIPGADYAFEASSTNYKVIYYILVTVGFLIARIIMGCMMVDRFERQGDVFIAGVSLGLGDAVLLGVTMIVNITYCNGIQTQGLEALINSLASTDSATAITSLETLFTAPAMYWLLLGVAGTMDLVVNIAMMMVVYGIVKRQIPKEWYILVVVGQFASSIAFQLADITSVASIWITFAVKTVIVLGIVVTAFKFAAKGISYSED